MTSRTTSVDPALSAAQRRMALMALLAAAWLLAAASLGVTDAVAYLAPTLALFALLLGVRYPGEDRYIRRLETRHRSPVRAAASRSPRPLERSVLPRGGALVAAGFAGRAPPHLVA